MWRLSAILFCILLTAPTARAGEIVKTDDSIESGQIVAFDGKDVQLRKVYGNNGLISVPIGQISRVQFHEGRTLVAHVNEFEPGSGSPQHGVYPLPALWLLKLATGDTVSGSLNSWSESEFDLRLQIDDAVLKIPAPLVREVWRASPDLVRKALDLKTTSATEDVIYVYKDGDVVAVRGTALNIDNDVFHLIHEGERKKFTTDRLLGVVLAPQKRAGASRPDTDHPHPHKLVLVNADVLTGRWTKLDSFKATFETAWGQSLEIRTEPIWRIETVDTSAVFLSDLKPVRVEQTPYFDRVIPWRADAALDGGPLRLNDGHQYTHGIAMHSRCVLEYDIDGKYTQFAARLGFEPLPPNLPPGRVAIRISADGSAKFESADFRSDQEPKDLTLDVRNAKRLLIEVDFGEGQDVNDRVVLANPRLLHSPGEN